MKLRLPSWVPVDAPDAIETLARSWVLRLDRRRYRSRTEDRTHDFLVVDLPDAVHVIALTRDRKLVLVRQFRVGSGEDSLETPGGILEPGEDPLNAGARELLEETGYSGSPARMLSTVWAVPSLLTSRISTIVIENVEKVADPHLDPTEDVQVELLHVDELPNALRDGRINHALVVQGLLTWQLGWAPL